MFSKFGYLTFRLRQIERAPWLLPLAFSVVAVATVLVSFYVARFAPDKLPFTIDHGALQSILTMLGSSMLTIAVFSLSTLVGAVSEASQSSTPRAVPLIVQDRTAQTTMSVFIGAFLFSIVGIIGLSSGIYSDAGRLVLFLVTLVVVLIVVVALIRWIDRAVRIGRISEAVGHVERAATKALEALADDQRFGCRVRRGEVPKGREVLAEKAGYLQHFDLSRLDELARNRHATIHILVWPGALLLEGMTVAVLVGHFEEGDAETVRDAFTIGNERTFEYDPRYGIAVLAEIGSRALSPGINDQGTALDVIGALVRTLAAAPNALADADDDPRYPQLTLPPSDAGKLFIAGFRPIARDGADKIEIALRLAKGLAWLARFPAYRDAAGAMLDETRNRAAQQLTYADDLDLLDSKIAELKLRYWSASPPSPSAS